MIQKGGHFLLVPERAKPSRKNGYSLYRKSQRKPRSASVVKARTEQESQVAEQVVPPPPHPVPPLPQGRVIPPYYPIQKSIQTANHSKTQKDIKKTKKEKKHKHKHK